MTTFYYGRFLQFLSESEESEESEELFFFFKVFVFDVEALVETLVCFLSFELSSESLLEDCYFLGGAFFVFSACLLLEAFSLEVLEDLFPVLGAAVF